MNIYERTTTGLIAPAGVKTLLAIPFLPNAEISKLMVRLTNGTAVPTFSVTLYSSKLAVAPNDTSRYQVCAKMTNNVTPEDATGLLKRFFNDRLPYQNQDGTGQSGRERKIYVEIDVPTGTGDRTWDVTLGAIVYTD